MSHYQTNDDSCICHHPNLESDTNCRIADTVITNQAYITSEFRNNVVYIRTGVHIAAGGKAFAGFSKHLSDIL
jgi:hypothetical protein